VAGYSEAILLKIGLRRKETIAIGENQMKRHGYFLFTINPNSKLNKIRKGKRYAIITKA
jgi:hypothetical protein